MRLDGCRPLVSLITLRVFWSGSRPLCRGRFCLCVGNRIRQDVQSATSLSERASAAPGALPCAVSGALPSVPVVPSAPSELTARGRSKGHSRDTPGLLWDTAPLTLRSDATPPSFPLERRRSSGPLCFVDPRFTQTRRHHRREDNRREDNSREDNRREDIRREDNPPWCVREPCNDLDDETSSVKPLRSSERHVDKTQPNSKSPPSRPRPPAPPPPPARQMPRRRPAPPPPGPPAATTRTESMPKASTASTRAQPSLSRRPAPPRPTMGSQHSGLSKTAISPALVPSNPPSPKPRKPDLEAHRCHIALDDETIAKALSRAKLPPCQPPPALPVGMLLEKNAGSLSTPKERLSDLSMSASSSGSMEYVHYPGFSPGPISSRRLTRQVEDSSEDEDGEEDFEEKDYGVSLEADLETRCRPSFKARRRKVGVSLSADPFVLPSTLKAHLLKVGGMLGSLRSPEKQAVKRIAELSTDKGSYFGSLVQDYISVVKENRGCCTSQLDFLQTVRQFMTQMKAYLRQSSELDPLLESLIPEDQIDQVLEKAMHKSVLKPLKNVIVKALQDFQVSSGAAQQLRENLAVVKTKGPQEMGADGAVPPDPEAISKIRHKFLNMRKMYSPEKKVSLMLRVCKLIYTIMQDNSGRMFGADDFLPMLTYVLAQCDMPQLDVEIQYTMELLEPSLLQGEGGYYLTSAYGAMALIKNFQEAQSSEVLRSQVKSTLHQWHKRRTASRAAQSVDNFQVSHLT
uniref:ras and Rab interactor 2 isoform X2 n=1 Tax=Gasterosteus aculeatus aculeatus TaxID=481459 RepID=UPI001A986D27|nr:ras and Rab interactor 2 isoform X2 [Gasterosteus aculeatus aculeatus]